MFLAPKTRGNTLAVRLSQFTEVLNDDPRAEGGELRRFKKELELEGEPRWPKSAPHSVWWPLCVSRHVWSATQSTDLWAEIKFEMTSLLEVRESRCGTTRPAHSLRRYTSRPATRRLQELRGGKYRTASCVHDWTQSSLQSVKSLEELRMPCAFSSTTCNVSVWIYKSQNQNTP